MTEELQDKELTDIRYLRARMTGNVGLALDHAYNLGFFDGEKNVAEKILNYLNGRERVADDEWVSFEIKELQKFIREYLKERKYKAEIEPQASEGKE